MPNEPEPPRVFICYAHEDADRAITLYETLRAEGANPWLDKKELSLGDHPWEHHIKRAVEQADAFVVCLRPGFDVIGFRQKEIRWAQEALELRPRGRGFIIPFILDPIKASELPDWCRDIHAGSDLSRSTAFTELVEALEKHCGKPLIPITYTRQRVRLLAGNLRAPGAAPFDRRPAAMALADIGLEAVPALIDALTDTSSRPPARDALARIGHDAVPALIDALQHTNANVRCSAAEVLDKIGSDAKHATPSLCEALKDHDSHVRQMAAWALGSTGTKSKHAVTSLIAALHDDDFWVRRNAAVTLGKFGSNARPAIPALIDALQHGPSNDVREAAAEALGKLESDAKQAVPALIDALTDGLDSLTALGRSAAEALGRIGTDAKQAVPALIEALNGGYAEFRQAAAEALGRIGSDAKQAIPALIETFNEDEQVAVRQAARQALASISADAVNADARIE